MTTHDARRTTHDASSPSASESIWAFATKSRCPYCHSIQTISYCTSGRFQWRRCRRCNRTYKEIGHKI